MAPDGNTAMKRITSGMVLILIIPLLITVQPATLANGGFKLASALYR